MEEQEIDDDGQVISKTPSLRRQITASSDSAANAAHASCIRDSSRNRLQRLGALYSNTGNLSSPIHRTEPHFEVEQTRKPRPEDGGAKPKTRIAKLTDLAKSINTWEDDMAHHSQRENVADAASTSRGTSATKSMAKPSAKTPQKQEPSKSILHRGEEAAVDSSSPKIIGKQLKWDKNVMDALESQGFKRRDTANAHLEYDFKAGRKASPSKPQIAPTAARSAVASQQKRDEAPKRAEVSKGLVSGRAAIFEHGERPSASQRQQKDPAEMSLKERMALFERNKGTALIPKAALGMAPSARQISSQPEKRHEPVKPVIATPIIDRTEPAASKISNYNKPVVADSSASGNGIRQTVAALLANPATISESQISQEVRKAREQDMNVLLNRFNRCDKNDAMATPPPPPPMPDFIGGNSGTFNKSNQKRRSDEKPNVSPQMRTSLEDSKRLKRVKVNPPKSGQVYPALTDIESATDSDKYATETYTDDDNNDDQMMERYMYSSQDQYEDER